METAPPKDDNRLDKEVDFIYILIFTDFYVHCFKKPCAIFTISLKRSTLPSDDGSQPTNRFDEIWFEKVANPYYGKRTLDIHAYILQYAEGEEKPISMEEIWFPPRRKKVGWTTPKTSFWDKLTNNSLAFLEKWCETVEIYIAEDTGKHSRKSMEAAEKRKKKTQGVGEQLMTTDSSKLRSDAVSDSPRTFSFPDVFTVTVNNRADAISYTADARRDRKLGYYLNLNLNC